MSDYGSGGIKEGLARSVHCKPAGAQNNRSEAEVKVWYSCLENRTTGLRPEAEVKVWYSGSLAEHQIHGELFSTPQSVSKNTFQRQ